MLPLHVRHLGYHIEGVALTLYVLSASLFHLLCARAYPDFYYCKAQGLLSVFSKHVRKTVCARLARLQTSLKEKLIMSASQRRYVAGIRSEVERTERALQLTGAVLEQWAAAQRDWLWLDCIFAAPDIQRQLPHEAKAFANADRALRDAARRAAERPNALQAATAPGEPAVKRQGSLWCRTRVLYF